MKKLKKRNYAKNRNIKMTNEDREIKKRIPEKLLQ